MEKGNSFGEFFFLGICVIKLKKVVKIIFYFLKIKIQLDV